MQDHKLVVLFTNFQTSLQANAGCVPQRGTFLVQVRAIGGNDHGFNSAVVFVQGQ